MALLVFRTLWHFRWFGSSDCTRSDAYRQSLSYLSDFSLGRGRMSEKSQPRVTRLLLRVITRQSQASFPCVLRCRHAAATCSGRGDRSRHGSPKSEASRLSLEAVSAGHQPMMNYFPERIGGAGEVDGGCTPVGAGGLAV